jgi:hypothetical protein
MAFFSDRRRRKCRKSRMRSRIPRLNRKVPPVKRIRRAIVKPVLAIHESAAVTVAANRTSSAPDAMRPIVRISNKRIMLCSLCPPFRILHTERHWPPFLEEGMRDHNEICPPAESQSVLPVPASMARSVMDQILKHGRVIRGCLGRRHPTGNGSYG